jgi:hypothetical protein
MGSTSERGALIGADAAGLPQPTSSAPANSRTGICPITFIALNLALSKLPKPIFSILKRAGHAVHVHDLNASLRPKLGFRQQTKTHSGCGELRIPAAGGL